MSLENNPRRNFAFVLYIVAIGGGAFFLIQGALEVYRTQNNIVDVNTPPLNDTNLVPFVGDTYVELVKTMFLTNDTFAVTNPMHVTIQIYVNDPNVINQTAVLMISENSNMSWTKNNIQLNKELPFFIDNKLLPYTNQQINKKYTLHINYIPPTTETQRIWVFVQTIDGIWHPYESSDLPTIESASSLIQLKNSKVVEGLTWVIVGFVPISLAAEFLIIYFIERHFYELERLERDLERADFFA